jgi:hypothetical protein
VTLTETEHFLFEYDESLKPVVTQTQKMVNYDRILKVFGLTEFRQVKVNLFENYEQFQNHEKTIFGKVSGWAVAFHGRGEIFVLVNKISVPEHGACRIFHELVHIIHNEVFKPDNRVGIWFFEGLAKFLSGEKGFYNNKERMQKFIETKITSKTLPDISALREHGETFKNDNYDGYDISFMCIRYLFDTLGTEKFRELIKDPGKTKALEKDIIQNALDYYMQK